MKSRLVVVFGALLGCGALLMGCPADNQSSQSPNSLTIEHIYGLQGEAAAFVFAEAPGEPMPAASALAYGEIVRGVLSVDLVVSWDSASNGGPSWTGTGEYYVAVAPVEDDLVRYEERRVYHGESDAPAKASFAGGLVALDYNEFKLPDGSEPPLLPNSLTIEHIAGLEGEAGVFVFVELPRGENMPANSALEYGVIAGGSLSVALVEPGSDNLSSGGPPWTGIGEYYVLLVPVGSFSIHYQDRKIYKGDGDAPAKVYFAGGPVALEYGQFSAP
jgi:hypothetical protein